jgi:bile acid:Na+ symporter, BASS family
MEQSLITALILPLALGIIMLGMGMTLTPADFRQVFTAPRAMVLGLANQLLLLPLLALLVALLFQLRAELAVGLLLVALCPGGPTSNIVSHLARADLALSVSLTAISSVITVFTIPVVLNLALYHYMGGTQAIQLPLGKTILQIFLVTVLPIAIGMTIRHRRPEFTARALGGVNLLSLIFFVLVLAMAIIRERAHLWPYFLQSGAAVVLLNATALALGFVSGKRLGLSFRQRVAISVETGIQNGTLAIALALSPLILNNPAIAIPAVIYSLTMFVSAAIVVVLARRHAV